MTSQAKMGSRWGSFLQQAVAGVESRLDTILADGDEAPPPASSSNATPQARTPYANELTTLKQDAGSNKTEGLSPLSCRRRWLILGVDLSRQPSVSRKADRLQNRLARAVVSGSSTRSSSLSDPHRAGVPPEQARPDATTSTIGSLSNRLEHEDFSPEADTDTSRQASCSRAPSNSQHVPNSEDEGSGKDRASPEPGQVARAPIVLLPNAGLGLDKNDKAKSGAFDGSDTRAGSPAGAPETHQYLERIDALEAKLRFMTEESVASARRSAEKASNANPERSLAEQSEKIALLMLEGEKLSRAEMKHLATIRRLRHKSARDEKSIQAARKETDQARDASRSLRDQLQQAHTATFSQRPDAHGLLELENLLTESKAENGRLVARLGQLQTQLAAGSVSGHFGDTKDLQNQVAVQKARTLELEDALEANESSRALTEQSLRECLQDTQNDADRERERARLTEIDLRRELQVAESRLETFLTRAEEVTSDSTRESQAKLARQVERLQSSYAVATENWGEIEKSLLAQVSRLENELNDAVRREADVRRKIKDCSTRCRELEVRVELLTQEAHDARTKWTRECETKLELQTALDQAQRAAAKVVPLVGNKEESLATADQASVVDVDPQVRQSLGACRAVISPAPSPLSETAHWTGTGGLHSDNGSGTQARSPNASKRPATGRTSSHARGFPRTREASASSIAAHPGKDNNPEGRLTDREAPKALTIELATTPTTPDQTVNDMFSVSTAAAGPSVQLVERLSASVRRLESEKTALKDELERHIAQRAETREQIVALVGEAEQKREAELRAQALEKEVQENSVKLATTLEMLGEKSELVEELRADIADMKEIYRSTLDNTVR